MSIKLRNNIPLFEINNPKFASSNLTVQDTRHVRDACGHCTDAFDNPSLPYSHLTIICLIRCQCTRYRPANMPSINYLQFLPCHTASK